MGSPTRPWNRSLVGVTEPSSIVTSMTSPSDRCASVVTGWVGVAGLPERDGFADPALESFVGGGDRTVLDRDVDDQPVGPVRVGGDRLCRVSGGAGAGGSGGSAGVGVVGTCDRDQPGH